MIRLLLYRLYQLLLLLCPFAMGYLLISNSLPLLSDEIWPYLTESQHLSYHSLWKPLIYYEIIGQSFFLIFSAWLGIVHFRNPILFWKITASFHLSYFLFFISDYFLTQAIPALEAAVDVAQITFLVQSALLLGLGYFAKRYAQTN
ncbi:DUF2569 family protein [Cytophagales bacterium LB-30]|uniref:DUF2569 family protein n=1 Tax=Shiella aurantiaca TaxID=3058365 RepID=A0ABT8F1J2_9BACT|nr:DUF2569 family protein [Shiella aurantiaca]MDN4164323.1 DUF2569 family protein [Shiella aurantiaca]